VVKALPLTDQRDCLLLYLLFNMQTTLYICLYWNYVLAIINDHDNKYSDVINTRTYSVSNKPRYLGLCKVLVLYE